MPFTKFHINFYGDGRQHENNQYDIISELLEAHYRDKDVAAFYFGNINVQGSELDSLLITPYCAIIIEFKNYGGIINISDNQWTNTNENKEIEVQGGSKKKTPAKQAEINKSELIKSIQHFKGVNDQEAKNFPIKAMIVFNQEVKELNGKLPDVYTQWLYITDNNHFIETLESIESDKKYILFQDSNEIEDYRKHIGAIPHVVNINYLDKAKNNFELGKYHDCLKTLKLKCDNKADDTLLLMMGCQYALDDKDITDTITSSIQHPDIEADAIIYKASILYYGKCGVSKNTSKAIRVLEDALVNIPGNKKIQNELDTFRQKEIEKEDAKKKYDENNKLIGEEKEYAKEIDYIIANILLCAIILIVYNLSDLFGWLNIHNLSKVGFVIVGGLFLSGIPKKWNWYNYYNLSNNDEAYSEISTYDLYRETDQSDRTACVLVLSGLVVVAALTFAFGFPVAFMYIYNYINHNAFDALYHNYHAFFEWLGTIRMYFLLGVGLLVTRWTIWQIYRGYIENNCFFLKGESLIRIMARYLSKILIYAFLVGTITAIFSGGFSLVTSCSNKLKEKTTAIEKEKKQVETKNNSTQKERWHKTSNNLKSNRKNKYRSTSNRRQTGSTVKKSTANKTTQMKEKKLTWVHARFDTPIRFESGSHRLSESNKASLRMFSQALKEHPEFVINIIGGEIDQYEKRNGMTDLPIIRNEVVHKIFRDVGITNKIQTHINSNLKPGSIEIYIGVLE